MMKYILLLIVFMLTACNSTSEVSHQVNKTNIIQLIEKAKKRFPDGVTGTFQLPIKASGNVGGTVYLNSDLNYKNQRNISVVLPINTIKAFTKHYGEPPETYFIGKTIAVTGTVKRVKIYLYKNGKRSKKYFFQTHIKINKLNKINVLPS